jgi:5'-3' exoribonuclease 1
MVQDSGSIPLGIKGVVVGINNQSMDVVWDVPFMSGTTLGDRFVNSEIASSLISMTSAQVPTIPRSCC